MWRSHKRSFVAAAIGVTLATVLLGVVTSPRSASATPHPGQSVNVAMIGSPSASVTFGGTFPEAGGSFGDFTFANLAPASVSAASLAAFDTALLNVASSPMGCSVDTLSDAAKTDLAAFVSGGGKLIIYDSECPAQDYSWLPYPFTTNNPGAAGANGTLTIAENNVLASASASDPHFIDAPNLGSETDAVGDMNVMTTLDAHWCLSMSGTNTNDVTGPVHTYARYGTGLFIYNGLDIDVLGDEPTPPYPNGLSKIWLQELQAPLNPSHLDLPCGILVIGTVTPSAPPPSASTPCIGGIESSRCPRNVPEVTATVAPPATATSAPATAVPPTAAPPKPTATSPTSQVLGIVRAPNTGGGPEDPGSSTNWVIVAALLLAAGAGVTGAVVLTHRR